MRILTNKMSVAFYIFHESSTPYLKKPSFRITLLIPDTYITYVLCERVTGSFLSAANKIQKIGAHMNIPSTPTKVMPLRRDNLTQTRDSGFFRKLMA